MIVTESIAMIARGETNLRRTRLSFDAKSSTQIYKMPTGKIKNKNGL